MISIQYILTEIPSNQDSQNLKLGSKYATKSIKFHYFVKTHIPLWESFVTGENYPQSNIPLNQLNSYKTRNLTIYSSVLPQWLLSLCTWSNLPLNNRNCLHKCWRNSGQTTAVEEMDRWTKMWSVHFFHRCCLIRCFISTLFYWTVWKFKRYLKNLIFS